VVLRRAACGLNLRDGDQADLPGGASPTEEIGIGGPTSFLFGTRPEATPDGFARSLAAQFADWRSAPAAADNGIGVHSHPWAGRMLGVSSGRPWWDWRGGRGLIRPGWRLSFRGPRAVPPAQATVQATTLVFKGGHEECVAG